MANNKVCKVLSKLCPTLPLNLPQFAWSILNDIDIEQISNIYNESMLN